MRSKLIVNIDNISLIITIQIYYSCLLLGFGIVKKCCNLKKRITLIGQDDLIFIFLQQLLQLTTIAC